MNSLAIYLICFKSGNIGSYRNYLLYFQIVCFLVDLHLTLLVAPTVFFPALLGISHGIFSNWFSIKTHYQINALFTLIVLEICALLCSFIRKHQSVAAIGNKNILAPNQKYLIKVLLHLPPLLVAIFFGCSNLDKNQETALATRLFPRLLPLLSLPNAELYSTSSVAVMLTLITMIFTFAVYCSLFLFVYFQILHMLHGHRQFMAARTYAKQIAAVVCLVAQLIVLIIWIAVPIGLLLAVVILAVEGMESFCNLLICLFSTHSIVTTFVMMFTFPAFRRILFCQDKPLFSPGTTVVAARRTMKTHSIDDRTLIFSPSKDHQALFHLNPFLLRIKDRPRCSPSAIISTSS
ncbi:unnamed protein product [Caenorhabditis sp. 36 PRJEB53466]|nr:unnamed protein product [Caenorhabditis sp. 36 PRJEB53466]